MEKEIQKPTEFVSDTIYEAIEMVCGLTELRKYPTHYCHSEHSEKSP